MISTRTAAPMGLVVARLDGWLECIRSERGYGGPVVHWWRDCLVFCGVGLDWRYEGIIAGYITLFERTGQARWLEKARRAGDDLVHGQLPGGNYRNSQFELNPGTGGTPHEAAADIGLLLLARTMRDGGLEGWDTYADAAEKNLRRFYIERLWSDAERRFRDDPGQPSFVPNKAATLMEALCLLADLRGREEYLTRYVRPTAGAIIAHQAHSAGGPLRGAIAQNTIGRTTVGKYFPYYNARCVPGLMAAYQHLGDEAYLNAALEAMEFVRRWRDSDGGFPQVVYENGRVGRYPRWVAATGDILRAADLLRPYGLGFRPEPTLDWLLAGQMESGALATADGFAGQVSQRVTDSRRDFRDSMPVAGWNDKAFRYLAGRAVLPPDTPAGSGCADLPCLWWGREAVLHDDAGEIRVVLSRDRVVYRWRKSASWAQIEGLGAP